MVASSFVLSPTDMNVLVPKKVRLGIRLDEEQQQRCLLLHVCVSLLFLWIAALVPFACR